MASIQKVVITFAFGKRRLLCISRQEGGGRALGKVQAAAF